MSETAHPHPTLVGLAFLGGLLLGGALVAPALPGTLSAVPSPSSLSPTGAVLVAGVLGVVVVVMGIAALYFVFLAMEG